MSSAPSAPTQQNLSTAAQQTALGNKQAVEAATGANRANQSNYNGSVNWTSKDVFDAAGYQAALDSWKQAGSKVDEAPNKALFTSKQWSSQETLNPDLQRALANQQASSATISGAAANAANRAASSLSKDYQAPQLASYLANVGKTDTSKINAPQFNWDVGAATSGAGQIQDFKGQVSPYQSNAKINTDVNGATAGVKAINQDGVGQVAGLNYTGPKTNTNFSFADNINTDLAGALSKNGVDTKYVAAPTYSNNRQDQYSKAAYNAQMALLQPDMERQLSHQQNKLALQGLGVDSEASTGAMRSFLDSQAAQRNQAANQAVLTGNQMSNNDYATALSGFNADRASQNQAFTQNKAVFDGTNSAKQQQFTNALTRFDTNNQAQQQAFNQAITEHDAALKTATTNQGLIDAQNSAKTQALTNALAKYQAGNASQNQQSALDQTAFNSNLAGTAANQSIVAGNNAAQQARYNQLLGNWQANNALAQQSFTDQVASQNQANQSQSQALAQALQRYQLDTTQSDAQRYQALKDYQALMTGQSPVSASNQFQSFATQGTYQGPDMVQAAQLNNQNAMAKYQAGVGQANATNSALVNMGATAAQLFAYSDKRLKTDIKTIGTTDSGREIKSWRWNDKAQKMGLSGNDVGLIAQDNKDIAVTDQKTGLLKVDYSKANTPKQSSMDKLSKIAKNKKG